MDKRKVTRIILLLTVPLLLLIFLLIGPSIITIESEQGADILITDAKDGSFKKIGTSKVTHVFFKKPPYVYVSAELEGKQTITSIKPRRIVPQSLRLDLTNTVSAKKISDGAVMDVIFSGNKGQGIVYGQNTLVNFNTNSPTTQVNPEFTGLPYIEKIIWSDFNNAVYLTDEGIGQFVNGVSTGSTNVGTTLSGDVNVDSSHVTDQGSPIITDISKTADKPLVLLSRNNIFTSNDMGTTLHAITSFEGTNRETNIFTTQDSIFKVSLPELGHTSEEDSKEVDKKPQITVDEYSYTGEKIRSILLDDDLSVVSIVKKNGTTYVLTQSGLHSIKDGTKQKSVLYFATPADMTLYKDRVVVLAKDGLWKVSDDGSSFQLLYRYTNAGIGLTNSMSVDPNNQLIFGTTPTEESSNSATFVTSF